MDNAQNSTHQRILETLLRFGQQMKIILL
ncbi:MAG: hypothetical protein LBJ67_06985 [Planctomycetaceae bacterium]|nr:hypothetical protein [Planctomycetaceae bacterium]